MKVTRQKWGWLAMSLPVGLVCVCVISSSGDTNSSALSTSPSGQISVQTQPSPTIKSPVDSFRGLLAMTTEERKNFLAIRPPEIRKRILEKIQEYEILPPDVRELRLLATDLRWYLLRLMNLPATNRAAQLKSVPARMRELVKVRLERWDLLPPPLKQQLLETGQGIPYFTFVTPAANHKTSLSENQRRKLTKSFEHLIGLTPQEKEEWLDTLSEAERWQMEETLQIFAQLPEAQREQCVQSFKKFANLSPAERQQFLKNADRWRLMSPAERQTWRELVEAIPTWPPMPPGMIPTTGTPPPPLPPGASQPPLPPNPPATVTNNAR
jgi:Protein of unknown function (DUF3106)